MLFLNYIAVTLVVWPFSGYFIMYGGIYLTSVFWLFYNMRELILHHFLSLQFRH